jgi:hypothetical protein
MLQRGCWCGWAQAGSCRGNTNKEAQHLLLSTLPASRAPLLPCWPVYDKTWLLYAGCARIQRPSDTSTKPADHDNCYS